MERCNLQAMLKLVKLCERHSTNRLRGFDFTARRTLSPPSMISIRRTSKDCTTFQQVTLSHTCHCHKLRLQVRHALLANDSAAGHHSSEYTSHAPLTRLKYHPLSKARRSARLCACGQSFAYAASTRLQTRLGSCTLLHSSGGWRKVSTVNHEKLKRIQEPPSRVSTPVLWRPHGSL